MSTPLVSIVIPCFNAGRWVAAAIDSARAQTWPELEIVFVDDGSTDDSLATAHALARTDARIVVLSQPNGGAARARNTGLAAARGDYVQFLDADDLLAPDKLDRQLAALRGADPRRLASAAWGRFDGEPAAAVFAREPVWSDLAPVDWLVCSWQGGGMMHPGAWLAPRAVCERAGPWNETLSLDDDGEYFARVVLASSGATFVPEARSLYRSHAGPRLSASRGARAALSSFTATSLKETHLRAAEDSPRTRRACACNYMRFAWENLASAPDLASRAIARWRELDPTVRPPAVGEPHETLAKLLGWRAARRLQLAVQRLRAR